MPANNARGSQQCILLSRWCGMACAWRETAESYDSVGAAEAAATERGIYRVILVCGDRRLAMEPFAIVGSHMADELQEISRQNG